MRNQNEEEEYKEGKNEAHTKKAKFIPNIPYIPKWEHPNIFPEKTQRK